MDTYRIEPYHQRRSVQWGHWGITFMDQQPDLTKNFGVIVGTLHFGVGSRGPVDGTVGSPVRVAYQDCCNAWVKDGLLPTDQQNWTAQAS
jgi:hypothetical protein